MSKLWENTGRILCWQRGNMEVKCWFFCYPCIQKSLTAAESQGFYRMKIRILFTPQMALAENPQRVILIGKAKLQMTGNLKGFSLRRKETVVNLKHTEIHNWDFKEFYDSIASLFCCNFEIQMFLGYTLSLLLCLNVFQCSVNWCKSELLYSHFLRSGNQYHQNLYCFPRLQIINFRMFIYNFIKLK